MTDAEDNTLSDEELPARIARIDERAFEILVRRHRGRILNLIYRSLGNRDQAEDVAQEVYLRVWRAARDFEPKAKFTSWLYRIAVIRGNTGSRCSVQLRLEFAVTARRCRSLFARKHRRFGKPLAWRERSCFATAQDEGSSE